MEERGLADSEGWTWLLARSLGAVGPAKLPALRVAVFDGFRLLTPSQAAVARALEASGVDVRIFLSEIPGCAATLENLGVTPEAASRLEGGRALKARRHTAQNLWEEVSAAAAWAKRLLAAGAGPGELAFIVRDWRAYRLPLRSACAEHGVPLAAPRGIAPALSSLLKAAASGWEREAVLSCAYAALEPAAARALRTAARSVQLMAGAGEWDFAARESPSAGEAWKGLRAVLDLIPKGPASGSAWVAGLRTALAAFAPSRLEAASDLYAQLEALERAFDVQGVCDLALAPDEFLAEADAALSDRAGGERGVRVLTPQDAAPLRFRGAWALGVVEGVYPRQNAERPLLSEQEREELRKAGLPLRLAGEEREDELGLFALSASRGEETVLSAPVVAADGSSVTPSHLLDELDAEEYRVPAEPASWLSYAGLVAPWAADNPDEAEATGSSLLRRVAHAVRVERDRERAPGGTRWDGALASGWARNTLAERFSEHLFSAAELSTYAECPMAFFLKQIMKLEPEEDITLALSYREQGLLLHDAFAACFRKITEAYGGSDAASLIAAGMAAFDELGEKLAAGALHPAAVRGDLAYLRDIFRAALDHELSALAEEHRSAKPLGCEVTFGRVPGMEGGTEPDYPELSLEGVRLRGRIDRIDEEADGLIITDYKLSTPPSQKAVIECREPQLPIYVLALERLHTPRSKVLAGRYVVLRKPDDSREVDLAEADRKVWVSAILDWVARIRAGRFGGWSDDCPAYCGFKGLCRAKHELLEALKKHEAEEAG